MKNWITTMCLGAALFVSAPTFAGPQQEKMKTCNAEASAQSLKGDARKAFMKRCLSADPKIVNSQQEKMKSCNAEASRKELKGEERKIFMSNCLKS